MGAPSQQAPEKISFDYPDEHPDAGSGDAESRGGDHRESCNNGTQGHNSYVMGNPSGNPLPSDSVAEMGEGDEIYDYGLNESMEVGQTGNQLGYGINGPAAGGGIDRNTGHNSGKA